VSNFPAAPDRVHLIARDPTSLFAFWTLSAHTRLRTLRALGNAASGARAALRVCPDEAPTRVIMLGPDDDTCIIEAVPRVHYEVEVGLATADGGFVPLARSAPVVTAPDVPSSDSAVTWVRTSAPTRPVAHVWSGRRVTTIPVGSRTSGSSDAHTP